jgi:hypothetical protein
VPAPAASTKNVEFSAHHDAPLAVLPALALDADWAAQLSTRRLDDQHGPPPRDAVIEFLHLTI